MLTLLALTAALASPCTPVAIDAIAAAPTPAVLVLGERHAHRADLRAAGHALTALAATGEPITLAFEAVHADEQAALTQHRAQAAPLRTLAAAVDWDARWGHAFPPYLPVLRAPVHARVAAGPPLGKPPADAVVDVPDAYLTTLAPMVAAHGMPPEALPGFARAMAWRDLRIAELAVNGWDRRGWLVILTGRGHVEGGIGVPHQLAALVDAPVHTALLGPTPCGPTDRVLRRAPAR